MAHAKPPAAARGDEAFQAGDAFGRLLLTRFLGAYLGDPAFRWAEDRQLPVVIFAGIFVQDC